MQPVALTVAGSDPSGGAGLQADLKTFHQHGVYGASVVTLLTVQNTRRVSAVHPLEPALVLAQLEAVLEDVPPQAAKTGALGSAPLIRAVGERAASFGFPLVVDPVMVSKHGTPLLEEAAVAALREHLLPRAFLITPNLHEAAHLTGRPVRDEEDMVRAAEALAAQGPRHVLVKGGALQGAGGQVVDVLWSREGVRTFRAPRVDSRHVHGTGCALSAALTARLARGQALPRAVEAATGWVRRAIAEAPGLGGGHGPIQLGTETE
jgi:hydroxymethylpyrimidine/phosphomethylpyrimidine kinase